MGRNNVKGKQRRKDGSSVNLQIRNANMVEKSMKRKNDRIDDHSDDILRGHCGSYSTGIAFKQSHSNAEDFVPLSTQEVATGNFSEEEEYDAMGLGGLRENESDDNNESFIEEKSFDENHMSEDDYVYDNEEAYWAWGKKVDDYYGSDVSSDENDAYSIKKSITDMKKKNKKKIFEDEEVTDMKIRKDEAQYVHEFEDKRNLSEDNFFLMSTPDQIHNLDGAAPPVASPVNEEDMLKSFDSTFDLEETVMSIFSDGKNEQLTKDKMVHDNKAAKKNFVLYSLKELENMNESDKIALKKKNKDIFLILMGIRKTLITLNSSIRPILNNRAKYKHLINKHGLSYFELKNQLYLSYIIYMSYFFLCKYNNIDVTNHPCLYRLAEIKFLIQKLQPMDSKINKHVDRLIKYSVSGHDVPRGHPEAFVFCDDDRKSRMQDSRKIERKKDKINVASNDISRDGNSDCSDYQDCSDQNKLSQDDTGIVDDESDDMHEVDDSYDNEEKIYKPPRMLALEYTQDHNRMQEKMDKEIRRKSDRLKKSELVRSLRESLADEPEEVGIEKYISKQTDDISAKKGKCKNIKFLTPKEKAFLEEDLFQRLPSSKKERKHHKYLKELDERKGLSSLGTTMNDLHMFTEKSLGVYSDDDPTIGKNDVFDMDGKKRKKNILSEYMNASRQANITVSNVKRNLEESTNVIRSRHTEHKTKNLQKKNELCIDGMASTSEGFDSISTKLKAYNEHDDEIEYLQFFRDINAAKESKKQTNRDAEIEKSVPSRDQEVHGMRHMTYNIEKNKGLTRKRKKFEGNARVHNKLKYEKKLRKLKSFRQDVRKAPDNLYVGDFTGMHSHLKKSRTLT